MIRVSSLFQQVEEIPPNCVPVGGNRIVEDPPQQGKGRAPGSGCQRVQQAAEVR